MAYATLTLRLLSYVGFTTKGSILTKSEQDYNDIGLLHRATDIVPCGTFIDRAFSTTPAGYLPCTGSTVGGATSNATYQADSTHDYTQLFYGLWAESLAQASSPPYAAVTNLGASVDFTAGGLISAAAAYTAGYKISLPDTRVKTLLHQNGSTYKSGKSYGALEYDRTFTAVIPDSTYNTGSGGGHSFTPTGTIDINTHNHAIGTIVTGGGNHTHSFSALPNHVHRYTDVPTVKADAGATNVKTYDATNEKTGVPYDSGNVAPITLTPTQTDNGAHSHTTSGSTANTKPTGTVTINQVTVSAHTHTIPQLTSNNIDLAVPTLSPCFGTYRFIKYTYGI